jgi:hypothetical protein
MKKYVDGHESVAGCSICQFISFTILGSLDIFYGESFEVILHSFDKG